MLENFVSEGSDPLFVALTKIKLRAFTNVALDAGGKWAVDFPAYAGLTLNVVQKGGCWLSIEGSSKAVCLRAGDCFLLTGGREFTLATDHSLGHRFRAEEIFPQAEQGIARVGVSPRCTLPIGACRSPVNCLKLEIRTLRPSPAK